MISVFIYLSYVTSYVCLLIWYTEWILSTPLSQLDLLEHFQRWHFKKTISQTGNMPLHPQKGGKKLYALVVQDFHVDSCSGNSYLRALYKSERGLFIMFIYCEEETAT